MGMLDSVTTSAPQLPTRFVMYAPEKAGKTSFGCQAPAPLFLMTAGETGLLSLIEAGQVAPTAHLPSSEESPTGFLSWGGLTAAVRAVLDERHEYKTLVVDTGNGAENLLAQHVCETDREFEGNWGEFNSFGRGERRCVPLWGEFLRLLDQVRVRRRMSVILLYHSKAKQFNNPTGKDYEQWKPEGYEKLWGLTHKWADVIGFYGLRVQVNKDDKAYKEERFLRLQPSAAIVAGNRYGLPDEITSAPNAKALWSAFAAAMKAAKSRGAQAPASGKPASPPPPPPPVQAPAPQPTPAPAANDGEGEDRSDFTPTAATTPAPTTSPTDRAAGGKQGPDPSSTAAAPKTTAAAIAATPTAAPATAAGTPAAGATATSRTTSSTEPAPKPMPAAERRTAPVPAAAGSEVSKDAQDLLALLHELDLSWTEVAGRREKGGEIALAAGLPMSLGHVTALTLPERNRLRTVLVERVEQKRARAEKRAENRARREAEAALEEVSAS